MFQYVIRRFISALILWVLIFSAQARASVFDYPRDATFLIIEYTQSHDMIRNADPQPMLRIYGNGLVHVHYPAYMKRAGDYEMYLSDAEIQQLLSSLEQNGVLQFDSNKIARKKKEAIAGRFAASNNKMTLGRTDDSRSRFKINLGSYMPGLSFIPQYDFKQEVNWKNLSDDAKTYPSVTDLQKAANAEQELRKFLNHRALIKISR